MAVVEPQRDDKLGGPAALGAQCEPALETSLASAPGGFRPALPANRARSSRPGSQSLLKRLLPDEASRVDPSSHSWTTAAVEIDVIREIGDDAGVIRDDRDNVANGGPPSRTG